jgi:hypothetical protein
VLCGTVRASCSQLAQLVRNTVLWQTPQRGVPYYLPAAAVLLFFWGLSDAITGCPLALVCHCKTMDMMWTHTAPVVFRVVHLPSSHQASTVWIGLSVHRSVCSGLRAGAMPGTRHAAATWRSWLQGCHHLCQGSGFNITGAGLYKTNGLSFCMLHDAQYSA